MRLAAGSRLDSYEIIALLGAGGMGEVYRARDTLLKRDVAIKVVRDDWSRDSDRLCRFELEAQATAALNHPNIVSIFHVGEYNGSPYIVTELLQGETLRDRLNRGPMHLRESCGFAVDMARGLAAAHDAGVVHRDLKPENLFLTKDGRLKILDFGLAKLTQAQVASSDGMTAAILPQTDPGQVVGTVGYMAPEQVRGGAADTRSDIFAFGVILYEMLTGRRAFQKETAAETMSAILNEDPPPVSTIQPMSSPALDRLVRKCVAKSPNHRWQSAADLFSELEWIAEAGSKAGIPAPLAAKRRNREQLAWLAAGLAGVLLLVALAAVAHLREGPPKNLAVLFQIPAPDKTSFYFFEVPAVSPDGERIAFSAAETGSTPHNSRLFVRPLNAATATEIPTPGFRVNFPFWSPDGRQIAFPSGGTLQRVDVSGGPPVAICGSCNAALGGTWNRDGVILGTNKSDLLYRVSAAGGEPKLLRPFADGETGQRWPQFLPDGKHYLYLSLGNRPNRQGIYAASLDSSERKFIVAANAQAAYVQSGQLLFVRGDVLMAQPFDLGSLKLEGEPRPVVDRIELAETVGSALTVAIFSASPNGVLVWRRGAQNPQSSLQWFDRGGKKLGVVGEPADYSNPALSPDDSKLAVCIRDPQTRTRDIWIFDLLRGAKTRLTFDPADDIDPVWSPDGTRIAFTSDRAGERNIYQKLVDGSGSDELLLGGKDGQENVEDWSRDGKYLMYNFQPPSQAYLYVLPLVGDRKPVPFLDMAHPTPFMDTTLRTEEGQFSPNGRWVAYRSLESGKTEIYVQRFTLDSSQTRGKWQVSIAGGELPRWRSDGKELFYQYGNAFYAVDVKTDGPSFQAGIPKLLFEVPTITSGIAGSGSPFGVTRDGQRFLVLSAIEKAVSQPLEVLVNWR